MTRMIAFMNSYSQGVSGGDSQFIEVAKHMQQYDKTVVTSLLGRELCVAKGLKADYGITTKERHFRNTILTYLRRILKALCLNLKPHTGDVVYGTSDFLPDVLPAFWLRIRNRDVKWIQRICHLIPSRRFISYCAQRISFLLIKTSADLIIVDSNMLKRDLTCLGFNADKMDVKPPGVDFEYLRNIAQDKTSYDGIFLGRLHPSKGIFDLVEIWKLICEQNPKATLAMVGYGDNSIRERLRRRIEDERLGNNIRILGYLERDKAFGLVKAARVFVLPSFEEGFAIAVCEAMACGVPVVAWDLPVYREIYPGGMIVAETGDSNDFADKVISLLQDRHLLDRTAQEAIVTASRYDWKVILEEKWNTFRFEVWVFPCPA
ncbi:MAG: glycosyltransferase family 4 protein [Chloroflexi bacterium]|nr:glycosyltransferase family 4 protein [Chloroflexota bacterium]